MFLMYLQIVRSGELISCVKDYYIVQFWHETLDNTADNLVHLLQVQKVWIIFIKF